MCTPAGQPSHSSMGLKLSSLSPHLTHAKEAMFGSSVEALPFGCTDMTVLCSAIGIFLHFF